MKITNRVHLIDGTKGSYAYLILGDEPVLVDTSLPGRANHIMNSVRSLGMKMTDIAHIVLTHHDVDHIGNANALKEMTGATIWASGLEVPWIHGTQKEHGIRRLIAAAVKVTRPKVDRTYDSYDKIGNLTLVPAPGHTAGHMCFVVDDVLLAGDLVTTRRGKLKPSPSIFTTDRAALKQSIYKVGTLTFDWVCPAHGDPVHRASLWETIY